MDVVLSIMTEWRGTMSKVKFQFNPNTGTMERAETAVESKAAASLSQVQKAKETVDMMDGQRRKPNVSMNEGQVIFREISDRDIIQIQNEKTRQTACVISGYALHFAFNLAELHSVESIEACLEGLKKLFRHKIMEQMAQKISPSE